MRWFAEQRNQGETNADDKPRTRPSEMKEKKENNAGRTGVTSFHILEIQPFNLHLFVCSIFIALFVHLFI